MFLNEVCPAYIGAAHVTYPTIYPVPDAFERLPINLTRDEIRAMVAEVLG